MDIQAIQAQQERMTREGQVPPDGEYVGYAVNLLKVVQTKTGRSLVFSFRADSRIEGTELRSAHGFELVETFQSYSGTVSISKKDGTSFERDNAASAIALLTRLGISAYGIKAIFDAADSADLSTKKSAIIVSNKTPLLDENSETVNLSAAGKPVKLVITTKDGASRPYINVRQLTKFEESLVA